MSTIATRYSLQWQSATTGKVSAAHAISALNDADALRICTLLLRRAKGVHGVTCHSDRRLVAWLPARPRTAPWDEHGINLSAPPLPYADPAAYKHAASVSPT
jgi:hypothetical protein